MEKATTTNQNIKPTIFHHLSLEQGPIKSQDKYLPFPPYSVPSCHFRDLDLPTWHPIFLYLQSLSHDPFSSVHKISLTLYPRYVFFYCRSAFLGIYNPETDFMWYFPLFHLLFIPQLLVPLNSNCFCHNCHGQASANSSRCCDLHTFELIRYLAL